MMTIEVTIDGAKYAIQRETFELRTAYDDFLNLMFLAGADLSEMAAILSALDESKKNNHEGEQDRPVSSPCNI